MNDAKGPGSATSPAIPGQGTGGEGAHAPPAARPRQQPGGRAAPQPQLLSLALSQPARPPRASAAARRRPWPPPPTAGAAARPESAAARRWLGNIGRRLCTPLLCLLEAALPPGDRLLLFFLHRSGRQVPRRDDRRRPLKALAARSRRHGRKTPQTLRLRRKRGIALHHEQTIEVRRGAAAAAPTVAATHSRAAAADGLARRRSSGIDTKRRSCGRRAFNAEPGVPQESRTKTTVSVRMAFSSLLVMRVSFGGGSCRATGGRPGHIDLR